MGYFIFRRSIQSLFSLVALVILMFFLSRLTGSPADLYLPQDATEAMRAEFDAQHGFDKPIHMQFLQFLVGLTHFDLGQSIQFSRPAMDVVLQAFPTTLMLAAVTLPIILTVSIVTGSLAAVRPGGLFDRVASLISLIGASTPNFWVAIVGMIVFAVTLKWLPTSGTGTPLHWVLPVTVLALRPTGVLVQVVRSSMVTALGSVYVKTARARGVGKSAVIFVHALRNALLPVITVASDQLAGIVNGAVIVETVFGFPGIGKLMIDSVLLKDFAVIQAAVLVTALAVFIINIIVDITYAIVDLASGTAEMATAITQPVREPKPSRAPKPSALREIVGTLGQDKFAAVSAAFLTLVLICALFGPALLGDQARAMNLTQRNAAPFQLDRPWLYILGADALGRSLLARIIVASQNTMLIAGVAVLGSTVIGGILGLYAGFKGGAIASFLLRLADAIMSFPTMLLAVIVLFVFEPGVTNVIIVLAISRIPIFLRTVRAEVLELRQRLFVTSALAMGASTWRILFTHIAPMVMPTVINLAALEMAYIMLVESGLSFLGIGIQPPEATWGLMVADGRNYIGSAWWVAFWPGLAIMLVTMSLNLFSNWLRIATDPVERWRLQSSAE